MSFGREEKRRLDAPEVLPLLPGPDNRLAFHSLFELRGGGADLAKDVFVMLRLHGGNSLAYQVLPNVMDNSVDSGGVSNGSTCLGRWFERSYLQQSRA